MILATWKLQGLKGKSQGRHLPGAVEMAELACRAQTQPFGEGGEEPFLWEFGNFAHGLFAGSWLQASENFQCSLFQSILPVTFAYRLFSGRLITQEGSCPAEVFAGLFILELPPQQRKIRAPTDCWFQTEEEGVAFTD